MNTIDSVNLDSILNEMPNHLCTLCYVAVCREKRGYNDEALNHINEYLMVKPDDNNALQLRARVSQA